VGRVRVRRCQEGTDYFARRIKDEGVPEIAGDGLIALAAFADNGVLDWLGDAVRRFVEEYFKGFVALVARIGAGDGDTQWVERGVGAGGISVSAHVDADFFLGPFGLIDIREALGNANTLFFDEGRDAGDPAAVGAVLVGPQMGAIDGGGGLQHLG